MRLLFVCPLFPAPLDSGSRVRWFNLAMQFQTMGHPVDLLSFASKEDDPHHAQARQAFTNLHLIRTGPDKTPPGLNYKIVRAHRAGIAMLAGVPRYMACAFHPELRDKLDRIIGDYDAVFIENFFIAANLSREAMRDHSDKLILVEHDIAFVPYLRHYRIARESGHLPRILKAWWHYRGIRLAELSTLKRFKRIVAMSPLDAATLSGLVPKATILTVPNGVDTEAIKPNRTAKPEQELVYVGGLSHRPNFDAIQHYQRDILPVLRTSMPEIRLSVLGETRGKNGDFRGAEADRILFVGWVPNAMPYYERCLAVVVPLRVGGGTRLKILDAFAAGTPVVSTRIGAEGLNVTHEKDILLADTPVEFANAINRLEGSPEFAKSIAAAGRALCETEYSWEQIVAKLVEQLEAWHGEKNEEQALFK